MAQVEIEVRNRPSNHSNFRLPAIAADLQFRALAGKSFVGMMRAKIDGVEVCAFTSQFGFQPVVDTLQPSFSTIATRYHRLIRDDNGSIFRSVQLSNRRR